MYVINRWHTYRTRSYVYGVSPYQIPSVWLQLFIGYYRQTETGAGAEQIIPCIRIPSKEAIYSIVAVSKPSVE
jgi:hypothetical protein